CRSSGGGEVRRDGAAPVGRVGAGGGARAAVTPEPGWPESRRRFRLEQSRPEIPMSAAPKTLVIRNGTLIDGSGKAASRSEALVIEGNKSKSVGALPPDLSVEDRRNVQVIDAAGQWIMPGLIDAHCHMSYGYPMIKGEGKGKGTTRPEFSTLKSARSAQK